MDTIIIDLMERFGYFGIFILIVVENLFPPIPSELILTFGGFMTTYTSMNVPLVILISTIGSVTGAVMLYYLGMIVPRQTFERFVVRVGGRVGFSEADVSKAWSWYDRFGYWSVFLCRMVPVVRSLISIPAGMARMTFWPFLAYTALGSLIWNTILIVSGSLLGQNWRKVLVVSGRYSHIMYVVFALLLLLLVVWIVRRMKHSDKGA